ncbi:hypothetical protein C475_20188 [Halosimplex carlsbadense 2-9-1]|uniref:Uncharacterized protein n=1 Tax=Halosimplex carlsbadense 2-9-1 TaxID=797114 RepID=M0CFG2_9EURY|nr:hypothetical protein [Halosimplex carlsbadense]ELZ20619.1 hypothetical protein C475_20188 [Halosimplex carlsbadense 2-9-1]
MTARRLALLAVPALLVCSSLAAVAVGPATAAPPPEAVCGVCGDGLADAAENEGIRLTAEYGAATIRVDESGTGHWAARVRVDDRSADRLAANATLRERVVRASLDRRTVVDDPRNLHTSVANDTLVVTFDQPDVAHESLGGVVLVDLLDPRTRRSGLDLEADELRIEGPNGTVVSRAPPAGTVEDGAVVWRPTDDEPGFGSDTRLAFAPSDGPGARALTTVGFVAFGVGLAEPGALVLGLAPALGLGALLVVVRRWGDELPTVDPSRLGYVLTRASAVAVLAAFGSIFWLDLVAPAVAETVLTFAVLYALVGNLAADADSLSARGALAWTLGAAVLVAVAASTVSIVALQTALLSVPAVLWFPLGRAHGRDRGVAALVTLSLLAAPFGGAVLYAPSASPVLGLVLSAFTTVPWAAATVAFGVPLYLLGRGPDDTGDPSEADGRASPASAD